MGAPIHLTVGDVADLKNGEKKGERERELCTKWSE